MSFESFKKSCLKNLGIEVDYEDYKQYLKDISEEDEKKPKPETEAQKRKRLNKEYEPILLARREKWNKEHPEEVARREKRKNGSNKSRESNEIKTLARIAKYNKNAFRDDEARKQSYEAAKLFLKKVCNGVLDKESFEKLKTKVLSKFKNKSFNEKLYREIKRTEFEDLDFSEKENGRYNDDVFQDIFPFIKFNPYHNQNHEKDVEDTLKYHGYFNY